MAEGALPGGPVHLLEVDPDLGQLHPSRLAAAAAALVAPTLAVDPGAWDARRDLAPGGMLLLEGLAAQQVVVAGATATELLGAGDFLHPGELEAERPFVTAGLRWAVLEPVTLAQLDARFAEALTAWPEVESVLLARSAERTARLGVLRAAAHVGRVEDRLLVLLWLLAGRHGRVGSDGVILPLALRHRILGEIVGARRSTVTLALGALERRGAITRRPEGGWLLVERPDDARTRTVRRSGRSRRA